MRTSLYAVCCLNHPPCQSHILQVISLYIHTTSVAIYAFKKIENIIFLEVVTGGLLFKPGGSNLQHATALSFLLLAYSRYLNQANREIHCGNVVVNSARLVELARSQVYKKIDICNTLLYRLISWARKVLKFTMVIRWTIY